MIIIIITITVSVFLCQSVSVMQTAVFLLTALTLVSVSVEMEPQGGAVTPVCLDTPGEEAGPAAQVQTVMGRGFSNTAGPDRVGLPVSAAYRITCVQMTCIVTQ